MNYVKSLENSRKRSETKKKKINKKICPQLKCLNLDSSLSI